MSGALGSGTAYLENKVAGHALGVTPWPMPGAVFVGLTMTQPSAAVPGMEVAIGGYSRRQASFSLAGNVGQNSAAIEFPAATASWGTLGWFELWDAAAGGNRLFWGTLVDPVSGAPVTQAIQAGDVARLPAGALRVSAF